MVNGRKIDPLTAATVGKISDITARDSAASDRADTNQFLIGDLVIDRTTGATMGHVARVVLVDAGNVKRIRANGGVRWSTPLAGSRPYVAIVAGKISVVSDGDQLRAFDDASGKPLWTAPVRTDVLATDGTYVFSTCCSDPDRALIALRTSDGKEAWRAPLAAKSYPHTIDVETRHLIVRDFSRKMALVFDHSGKKLYQIDEWVQVSHLLGSDLLVYTGKRLALYEDDGHLKWSRAPLANTFAAGLDLIEVGTDLVLANYGHFNNSGVDLVRLDRATGALRWESKLAPLGVDHAKSFHIANLQPRGSKLYVVSQCAYGSFYERIDLSTGKRELRCDLKAAKCAVP